MKMLRFRHRVPGGIAQRDLASPRPQAQRINQNQQYPFHDNRVAEAQRGIDRRVKSWQVVGLHNASFHEPPYQGTDTVMNYEFRNDEHRQRNQESNMGLNVMQERNLQAAVEGVTLDQRQDQKRQPGE